MTRRDTRMFWLAQRLACSAFLMGALASRVALAAPTEDGSIYVLAEGGPASAPATLRSLWRREASKACQGDYMVMSESSAQSRRAGLTSRKLHEGYVRCVSPEAADDLLE